MAKKTDNVMSKTKTKNQSLGQVLRIAGGGGGIDRKEFEAILETGGKNISAGQVVQRLDKINAKLAKKDLTGINIKSGAANYLTKQASKPSGDERFQSMIGGFGTGRLGQTLQSMVGSPGFAGSMFKGQLQGGREPIARTILPRGMDLRPSGRQTVRGIGKQYEVPSRLMQPSTADATTTTGGTADATTAGGTADGTTAGGTAPGTPTPEEALPGAVGPTTEAGLSPFRTALANWAQGFRRKKSSRQQAGRGAQGLASMKAPTTNTLGY